MAFVDFDVFLDTAQPAKLGFDADPFGMRFVDDALGNGNVLLERFMAGVDHDRAVKPGSDTVVACFLVAVIKVHGKDRFGKHSFGRADNRFEHALVSIFTSAFGKLNDEWRLALHIAAKQAEALFHVVNVVSADGELAVSDLVQLSSGDDHKETEFQIRSAPNLSLKFRF